MLDRTLAPPSKKIEAIQIPDFKKKELHNGVPLYYLDQGTQEVVKLEIILSSGVCFEEKEGTSFFVSRLLTNGTKNQSASQIAERLDYYGAFLETSAGFDHITISAYCLKKFLKPILDLIFELLTESTFPKQEIETLKRQKLNELAIGDQKDSQVAAKKFRQNLFGLHHPYGEILSAEQVESIDIDELSYYYKNILFNQPIYVLSGKVDTDTLNTVSDSLGKLPCNNLNSRGGSIIPLAKKEVLKRPQSIQSSIRIGKKVISRQHEDIHKLHITTSLLGGYFGSRLMRNIREDKGYTYGIGASIAHLMDHSFLVISTDVVKKNTADTVKEIYKEIDLLKTTLIEDKELLTIKNYLAGQFLNGLDSPFSIASKFKSVLLNGLTYEYYADFLSTLDHITPRDIKETARKYYDVETMNMVIVGEDI